MTRWTLFGATLCLAVTACAAPRGPGPSSAEPPPGSATKQPGSTEPAVRPPAPPPEPENCHRMFVLLEAIETCPVLTEAQRAAFEQVAADAVASHSEVCLDNECEDDDEKTWREELSCETSLEAIYGLRVPCPTPIDPAP